jgi:Glycoside hydrolase family 44
MNRLFASLGLLLTTCSIAYTQPTPTVQFNIDAKQDVKPISRYIYGINQFHGVVDGMTGPYSNVPFVRLGGNRFTAYNWVTNASNAGNDYHFQNDDYLVSGDAYKGIEEAPGGADMPIIQIAKEHQAAVLLTVPINGYVSADKKGDGDVRKSGADYLRTRFLPELPRKKEKFSLTPDPKSTVIYEDEFVNWLFTKYPYCLTDATTPIWLSLDNEPDFWSHTHKEIHPQPLTYEELTNESIDYASAIKDVAPAAIIFGPVNYGWSGYTSLQDAPDAKANGDFQSYYLSEMAKAEKTTGKRLLDVFDVHWYPEATGNGIRVMGRPNSTPPVAAARMAAPRSLWDSTYTETSWITKASTHGPIRLIPRLREKIEKNYPGTKLAITEYDPGGGNDISGGIAQADMLGIFGREEVFAAALWPGRNIPYLGPAIEMYRNFDGENACFGDISVKADTDDIKTSSIYASLDSANAGRMVLVAINKTDHPIAAAMQLKNAQAFKSARVFRLTGEKPAIQSAGILSIEANENFTYTMPAFSVSTLELMDKN